MIIGFDTRRHCPIILPQKPHEQMMVAYAIKKHNVKKVNLTVLQTLMEWFMLYHEDRTAYEAAIAALKPKK